LLLKAALIQVSDYRLLGASGSGISWKNKLIFNEKSLVLIVLLVPDKMVVM
jgi:hypothetical protein